MKRTEIFVLGSILLMSACSSDATTTNSTKSYSAPISSISICSGFGCIYQDKLSVTQAQESELKDIFRSGAASATAERAAIARYISTMERMSLSNLRFAADVKRSYQRNSGVRGQMDCVDETRNTTAYLKFAQSRGWLLHHRVSNSYVNKGFVLDGTLPHRSAVIIDRSGKQYVVDSWPTNNGGKPLIISTKQWKTQTI